MVEPYWQGNGAVLYHGDCLDIGAWLDADVLVTDPPYGMAYTSNKVAGRAPRPIAGDHDTSTRDAVLALWGDRPACVFGTWKAPRPAGVRQLLIWDKTTHPGMGDLTLAFGSSHEEVYLLGRWAKRGRRQGSVLRTTQMMSGRFGLAAYVGHPTPKPLDLMRTLIDPAPDGIIADPFAGSGSTLLAALALGRQVIGVEVEERYCEIAARRLEAACQPDLFASVPC